MDRRANTDIDRCMRRSVICFLIPTIIITIKIKFSLGNGMYCVCVYFITKVISNVVLSCIIVTASACVCVTLFD